MILIHLPKFPRFFPATNKARNRENRGSTSTQHFLAFVSQVLAGCGWTVALCPSLTILFAISKVNALDKRSSLAQSQADEGMLLATLAVNVQLGSALLQAILINLIGRTGGVIGGQQG